MSPAIKPLFLRKIATQTAETKNSELQGLFTDRHLKSHGG